MADEFGASVPVIERFDGAAAWAALTPAERDRIGALALELVNVWQLIALDGPGPESALPPVIARAASQADDVVCSTLEMAVLEALPVGAFMAGGVPRIPSELGGVCRACGCSHFDPCEQGCGWAAEDLCTACASGEASHG